MKIIKNGKLFGKLNIIDLLILLVVIAAAVFLILRFTGGEQETPVEDTTLSEPNFRYTVVCEDVPLALADSVVSAVNAAPYEMQIDEGEPVSVNPRQIYNGSKMIDAEIISVEILPAYEETDGQLVNLSFVVEATATSTSAAYQVGSQEVRLGKGHIVKTVDIELTGTVTAMESLHG